MAFEAVEGGRKAGEGAAGRRGKMGVLLGGGEVGSGVVVGLAWSWRCSRWCPGRRGASIARLQQGPAQGSGRVVAVHVAMVVGCSG